VDIANGHLAIMAIIGLFSQHGLTGSTQGAYLLGPGSETTKLTVEIANGHLAIMAILACSSSMASPTPGDWALYAALPLRAFVYMLGVQAPVGFWGLAGFTSKAAPRTLPAAARRRSDAATSPSLWP
jgi:hypothetical protein